MLSTTDRRHAQQGQIIVLMAGGMIALVLIAALVFDVGQNLLDRRSQQNASDAAALAGARFLALPGCKPVGGVQPACSAATTAALDIAAQNGYIDGVDGHTVEVHIPPNAQSQFNRFPGHVQVVIGSTRGSFFSGVIGAVSQNVDTQAVAANIGEFSLPFALLALNPSQCGSVHITGNGTLNINADIQVNSTCNTSGAFQIGGAGATVNAATADCSAVGTIKVNSGTLTCNRQEGVEPQLFPAIGGPGLPPAPLPPVITGSGSLTIPDGCPGASGGGRSPSTEADPKGCTFQYNANKVVRIYPGVYWGGLTFKETGGNPDVRIYMEPGIYYIAGGGFLIDGDIVLLSVAPGGTTFDPASTTMGVMIYNTDDPQYHDACVNLQTVPAERVHQGDRLQDRNVPDSRRGSAPWRPDRHGVQEPPPLPGSGCIRSASGVDGGSFVADDDWDDLLAWRQSSHITGTGRARRSMRRSSLTRSR